MSTADLEHAGRRIWDRLGTGRCQLVMSSAGRISGSTRVGGTVWVYSASEHGSAGEMVVLPRQKSEAAVSASRLHALRAHAATVVFTQSGFRKIAETETLRGRFYQKNKEG